MSERVNQALLSALKRADQFITNGIALGYIRMPDADTPDTAHETPGIVRAAIEAAESQPAAATTKSQCNLGCITSCKAREHGCASECPALPWQPAAAPAPEPAVRVYWHAAFGWQVDWLAPAPNGGQSNYYYAAPPPAAPAVPPGFVLVPVEPTEAMLEAFQRGFTEQLHRRRHGLPKRGFKGSAEQAGLMAMLAAAPQAAPAPQALTDQQIMGLTSDITLAEHPGATYDIAVARAIERAHGIGGQA
jgi:hypothetical protein